MLIALLVLVLQWVAMLITIDVLMFPSGIVYGVFLLIGFPAWIILAYYIGKDGEKAFKKKK